MKTNQILTHKIGDFNVNQRTCDGMFNTTELLKQWNEANTKEKRDLHNFWKSTHLDKLMYEIAKIKYNF